MPTFVLRNPLSTYSLITPRNYRKTGAPCLRPGEMGGGIHPQRITALLRSTVTKNGHNPSAFSLHPLRAGGATALYRATKGIDLVALFGRWETQPIPAYIWGSLQMMDGAIDHMVMGVYDTQRGKFPGGGEETRPSYPSSRAPQVGRAAPGG